MCLTYMCVYYVWSHELVCIGFHVGIANTSISTERVYVYTYTYPGTCSYAHVHGGLYMFTHGCTHIYIGLQIHRHRQMTICEYTYINVHVFMGNLGIIKFYFNPESVTNQLRNIRLEERQDHSFLTCQ